MAGGDISGEPIEELGEGGDFLGVVLPTKDGVTG